MSECQDCAHYKALVTALQEAVRQQHRLISYVLHTDTTDADRLEVKKALLRGPDGSEGVGTPSNETEGKGSPTSGAPENQLPPL